MAYIIPQETFGELQALAEKLMARARAAVDTALAEGETTIEGPEPYRSEMAQVQAFTFAMDAALSIGTYSQLGVVLALASETGSVLGRATGNRSVLWEAFKSQCGASIEEITTAVALATGPAEGNA